MVLLIGYTHAHTHMWKIHENLAKYVYAINTGYGYSCGKVSRGVWESIYPSFWYTGITVNFSSPNHFHFACLAISKPWIAILGTEDAKFNRFNFNAILIRDFRFVEWENQKFNHFLALCKLNKEMDSILISTRRPCKKFIFWFHQTNSHRSSYKQLKVLNCF